MSEEKFFDFSSADSADEESQAIIATFTQPPTTEIRESSSHSEGSHGPGYYIHVDNSATHSNEGTESSNESISSTPTKVMQHLPQSQVLLQQQQLQQQQLSATIAFHQAAAVKQAAQLASNAAALQVAQAQAMHGISNASMAASMGAMSLQPQTMSSVSMPLANSIITNSVTGVSTPAMQVPNPAYSDGTTSMGEGTVPVPLLMHESPIDLSESMLQHQRQQGGKGNRDMPPTPPASADEKDHDDPKKQKAVINMIPSGACPVPVSLMQLNGQNIAMQGAVPGPTCQMVQQFGPAHVMGAERMPVPMTDGQPVFNQIPLADEELSPDPVSISARSNANSNKKRGNKKPVPVEDKDDKYYERRKRNNMAAKRSRDARKYREDTIAMRANYLERENAILRAQLATLREEANSLRQLLSQRTVQIGTNGQTVNALQ